MPWALQMAADCLDMKTGEIRHWPRPGGWYEQEEGEMEAMRLAWRTWVWFTNPQSREWGDAIAFIGFLSECV